MKTYGIGWVIAGVGSVVLFPVVAPFILGLYFAFAGLPFVRFFCRYYDSRALGSFIFVFILGTVFLSLFFLIVPILYHPLTQIWQGFHQDTLYRVVKNVLSTWMGEIPVENIHEISLFLAKSAYEGLAGSLQWLASLAGRTASSTLMWFVLTPLMSFYFLKDWPWMVRYVWRLLPRRWYGQMIPVSRDIQRRLHRYIQGQMIVCGILAIYYSVCLSVLHLHHGEVLGLLSGIFSFIPYGGLFVGFTTLLTVNLVEMGAALPFLGILGVFVGAQILEGMYLTPVFIGRRVHVHPLTILFMLVLCGTWGGILMLFFSVPLAIIATSVGEAYKSVAEKRERNLDNS